MSDVVVAPYPFDMEPEEFRFFVYSDENAQRVRWWRSVVDPSFNKLTGRANPQAGAIKWLHEEVDVSRFQAVVTDSRRAVRYYPQGTFAMGDLVIMVMPDEIDIGDHDWICPMGRGFGEARTMRAKEPLIRGERAQAGSGTVSSSGAAVTGVGTQFTTFLRHGDIVEVLGVSFKVDAVTTDTALTLTASPSPAWSANTFDRRRELLTYWPAAAVEEVRDMTGLYIPSDDFVLDGDRTLNWVGNSPEPGATMSIVYRYYPLYQVVPDTILGSHGVGRLPQPVIANLRLIKPDALQE